MVASQQLLSGPAQKAMLVTPIRAMVVGVASVLVLLAPADNAEGCTCANSDSPPACEA
jgi:hypothetical protein